MANFTSAFRALAHGSLNWDTQLDADLLDLEARLKDSGWITAGASNVVAAPNWTLGTFAFRVINGSVSVIAVATRTASATGTANAQGVLAPLPVLTFPASSILIPAVSNGVFASIGSASTAHVAGYARTDGVVIAELTPSTSIPVGGVVDLKGTYLL